MRSQELENWARQVIERVCAGKHQEDARVELKAAFPDPDLQVARKLAGHANAAAGDHVLWLFGVDESKGAIMGVRPEDLANWLPQVTKHFENAVSPRLIRDHQIAYSENRTVTALAFATDDAPYVVKHPQLPHLETPWRTATSTKSAGRAELLRLLVPRSRVPVVEELETTIKLELPHRDTVSVEMRLWLSPVTRERVTIPRHRCSMWLTQGLLMPTIPIMSLGESRYPVLETREPRVALNDHALVYPNGDSLIVDGHGTTLIRARAPIGDCGFDGELAMSVRLLLYFAEARHEIRIERTIEANGGEAGSGFWHYAVQRPSW